MALSGHICSFNVWSLLCYSSSFIWESRFGLIDSEHRRPASNVNNSLLNVLMFPGIKSLALLCPWPTVDSELSVCVISILPLRFHWLNICQSMCIGLLTDSVCFSKRQEVCICPHPEITAYSGGNEYRFSIWKPEEDTITTKLRIAWSNHTCKNNSF